MDSLRPCSNFYSQPLVEKITPSFSGIFKHHAVQRSLSQMKVQTQGCGQASMCDQTGLGTPSLPWSPGHSVSSVSWAPWTLPCPRHILTLSGSALVLGPSVTLSSPQPSSQSELPLTDREMEILNKTTGLSQSTEGLPDSMDEEVAPPKPPLPGIRVVDNRYFSIFLALSCLSVVISQTDGASQKDGAIRGRTCSSGMLVV